MSDNPPKDIWYVDASPEAVDELELEIRRYMRDPLNQVDPEPPAPEPEPAGTGWQEAGHIALILTRYAGVFLRALADGLKAFAWWITRLEAPAQFMMIAFLLFGAMFMIGRYGL
jgi:hypothetical protein